MSIWVPIFAKLWKKPNTMSGNCAFGHLACASPFIIGSKWHIYSLEIGVRAHRLAIEHERGGRFVCWKRGQASSRPQNMHYRHVALFWPKSSQHGHFTAANNRVRAPIMIQSGADDYVMKAADVAQIWILRVMRTKFMQNFSPLKMIAYVTQ